MQIRDVCVKEIAYTHIFPLFNIFMQFSRCLYVDFAAKVDYALSWEFLVNALRLVIFSCMYQK